MANVVFIIGRLGQDPEIKYFESGSVKASFSMAVDRTRGKDNKETDWFNVEVWGRTAEFVGEWVKKGQLLSVYGQLEVQRWTDPAGNVKERVVIRANDVQMEGSKRDTQIAAGAGAY
jgi:single-strand DNA-binding protein